MAQKLKGPGGYPIRLPKIHLRGEFILRTATGVEVYGSMCHSAELANQQVEITDDLAKVTCGRCLTIRRRRIDKGLDPNTPVGNPKHPGQPQYRANRRWSQSRVGKPRG